MRLDHLRGTPGSRSRLEAQVWEGARLAADPAKIPELAEVDIPAHLEQTIRDQMGKYPEVRSAAIPALRAAQEEHGWLSPEAIVQVAAVMHVTPAYLESVASFYDMFDLEPSGRHTIYVCTNISCTLRGADELLADMAEATGAPVNGTSPDGEFRLRRFECLGACDIAPMASIDGYYRGPLTRSDAAQIVEDLRSGRPSKEVLPERSYEGDYARRLGEREKQANDPQADRSVGDGMEEQ
jgi:NADH-quinone oxidoreductase subunit E